MVVVSGDRDLLQIVAAQCEVLFMGRRGKPATRYDRVAVEKRFGIPPERLPGYVALVGDPADDIPKVKGIGKAIASQLMSRYASVAELLDDLPSIEKPALRALLSSHAGQLQTSEQLARLHRDLPLPRIEPAPFDAAARERTRTLLEALEFESLLPRLGALC